ncbi:Putative adhesin [Halobiforma haloterrestris]|uniref:Putative adhesin n=1 Tax=Natronobacterium haloterrestre TaxID=148448 RepID=A0A1I1EHX2_NATHA|nr:DUF4097 family beta strand repeat-containing protein [Halobiforma haloterrestris]SFB84553.1 Putative adhesin [Halobiforma haloterrestris]
MTIDSNSNPDVSRRTLLGGIAVTASAALAGCTGTTPFVGQQLARSDTVPAADVDALRVYGKTGEITVTGGDRDDVAVDIEKQSSSVRTDLENLELRSERTDGTLELRSEWDGTEGWLRSRPSMDLEIDVPRELALEEVSTSVGEVTVRDVAGDLRVDTSTGRIDVANVDGGVGASASTGRVEIRDVERLDDVSTSTGRIEVDVPAIDGDTSVTASTGRIEAAIDPDLDAELRVETSTGRIEIEGLELQDATRGDDVVTGALGDGGPTLRFETSTGRIELRALE